MHQELPSVPPLSPSQGRIILQPLKTRPAVDAQVADPMAQAKLQVQPPIEVLVRSSPPEVIWLLLPVQPEKLSSSKTVVEIQLR